MQRTRRTKNSKDFAFRKITTKFFFKTTLLKSLGSTCLPITRYSLFSYFIKKKAIPSTGRGQLRHYCLVTNQSRGFSSLFRLSRLALKQYAVSYTITGLRCISK